MTAWEALTIVASTVLLAAATYVLVRPAYRQRRFVLSVAVVSWAAGVTAALTCLPVA